MNSKFSLADLFIVLSALGFGFISFQSFNYLSFGETEGSVIKALALALLLGGFAFAAKLLKRTDRPSKAKVLTEGIFLFLFAVTALIATFPFSHYFKVEGNKASIQRELIDNINKAEKMLGAYEEYVKERSSNYKEHLESVVRYKNDNKNEYKMYGFDYSIDDYKQINTRVDNLERTLKDYSQLDADWFSDAKRTITNWNLTSVVPVVKVVKEANIIIAWKNELSQISTYRQKDGTVEETATNFDYSLTAGNTQSFASEFSSKGDPTPLSIICAIILFMFMLLSYFITKRHSRWPGLKVIFGTGNVAENEL
ncbi:MAG: hypothetical protein FWC26_10935 [Fibromonadales bacterium]|nr:hypothetical protein [Fibromonadales bacterium]